jgi:CPA2 family monovalent cation:H+ antiporter-2
MLGLEHTGRQLVTNLRSAFPAAIVDFGLNFTPGIVAGLLLKWKPLAAILLGGVTYVSSSGVIAKVLAELRLLNNPETPAVLSILVLEDLAMAVYLPLVAVLLAGGGSARMAMSVSLALAAVLLVLALAVSYGVPLSRVVAHQSDEIVLLTIFGAVLLVAGAAQRLQVSAAIGAFLVGIAVSGPMAEQTHRLLAPLRDLFAATFFFFFGLQIDPATLRPALPSTVLLGIVTAATKVLAGFWAARRTGVDRRGRLRSGMALVARGEFSIVIAGLGAGLEPQLGRFQLPMCFFWRRSVPSSPARLSRISPNTRLSECVLRAW